MYVIAVIPFLRGSQLESLTYYSSIAYETGSIIKVPVRAKEVRAMVVSAEPVSAAKTAVRAATFTLKKLPEQTDITTLPPILVEAARTIAKEVPASLGAILFALLPEEVREGTEVLESNLPCIGIYETPAVTLLQAIEAERLRVYRSHIREAFAHRGSVLFVAPTSADALRVGDTLAQGIESRLVTLTNALTPKKRERAYQSFHDLSQAKLIIATPSHCFIDRHDITHIIIDQCRSPYYKARTRPYMDTRQVLKTLAKISGRQILMGDLLPSTEDEWLRREDIYTTEGEHPKRIAFESQLSVIKQTDKPKPDVPFVLYSPKLLNAITDTVQSRQHTLLYAARRGLSPVVVCIDCGHIFRCPDSGTPYSLFRTTKNNKEQRWFLSTTSGKRVKAADVCPDCGSWRLKERGVGIQHMYDELTDHFPKANVILFDHTTASTKKKAQNLIADFYETKGSILLGTAMALPYLDKPVTLSAITSVDAARTVPTWRADEDFFALLLRLREITTKSVLIQTRAETDDVLSYAKTGQVEQFYTDELSLRSTLKYPPYSVFIHLTFSGSGEAVSKQEEALSKTLTAWPIRFYSAPQSTVQTNIRYGLLRIPALNWPDETLIKILAKLPPAIRVEINPGKIV